jgi:hypothetical protein
VDGQMVIGRGIVAAMSVKCRRDRSVHAHGIRQER